MEEFYGEPKRCVNFTQSPCFEEVISVQFNENQCLLNSYNTSTTNGDLIVEGVLLILSDGKVADIVRHCWNKHDNTYYDVTKDYVWNTDEFQTRLHEIIHGEVSYQYFSCGEYKATEYVNGTEIEFKYDYSFLISYMRQKISLIKPEDWVQLKSDNAMEYNVRGISETGNILDCLTFGGGRCMLNKTDIELIIDKDRLGYLDSRKNELFNI